MTCNDTPPKTVTGLRDRYHKLGVHVVTSEQTANGEHVATGFLCTECGCTFCPPAAKTRGRHLCPKKCHTGGAAGSRGPNRSPGRR